MTDSSEKIPLAVNCSKTVVGVKPPKSNRVESCFGSHPICRTFFPFVDRAAITFERVVDFPIPPFP